MQLACQILQPNLTVYPKDQGKQQVMEYPLETGDGRQTRSAVQFCTAVVVIVRTLFAVFSLIRQVNIF